VCAGYVNRRATLVALAVCIIVLVGAFAYNLTALVALTVGVFVRMGAGCIHSLTALITLAVGIRVLVGTNNTANAGAKANADREQKNSRHKRAYSFHINVLSFFSSHIIIK
jgi:uncharacterized membrane protein